MLFTILSTHGAIERTCSGGQTVIVNSTDNTRIVFPSYTSFGELVASGFVVRSSKSQSCEAVAVFPITVIDCEKWVARFSNVELEFVKA
jgi:hypothetical protein